MTPSAPPSPPVVEWSDSAGAAAHLMREQGLESVTVMADGRPLGRIARRDIERCESRGNWLEAVLVRDLVQPRRDTCN